MISIGFLDLFCGILLFVLMVSYTLKSTPTRIDRFSESQKDIIELYALGITYILLFGLRDYNSHMAGDSWLYAYCYDNLNLDTLNSHEWFWKFIIMACRFLGLTTSEWFTLIAALYILPIMWGCKKICPDNPYILFLSFISCFIFTSNGINGIRNGVACSIAFCAVTYAMTVHVKLDWIKCAILCILAYGVHQATIMIIVPLIASIWFVKSVRVAIIIWIATIMLSIILGNSFASLVAGFSEDDRAASYLFSASNLNAMAKFSSSGFRIDFLLYSAIPIIVGYYATYVKKITNTPYRLLLVTYILSNALWVIFIRAAYSNRFAMLSWSLYPFVLIYPYAKPNWSDFKQVNQAKLILWMQYSMTIIL